MNIIKISIIRPVFAWILMSALIIFGSISFLRLGISQMPDVDFPIISISLNYEGASPEIIESDLIDPFEERLLSLEGLKEIKSTARQGSANIRIEFNIDRNVDVALQEVQAAISQIRLPTGVIDNPIVRKQNPEEEALMYIGIWADKPTREIANFANDFLADQLQTVPGAGDVSVSGFSTRNLRVWIDQEKLKKSDLTVTDVLDSIQQQHVERSAGYISDKKTELNARQYGEAQSVEEFANLPILKRGGGVIYNQKYRLKDFARIEDGLSDIRRVALIEGNNAISISVKKQRGSNEVALGQAMREKVKELQSRLPEGYKMRIIVDFTTSTEATVHSTQLKLLYAGIVTVLIVFLFLGSFASAFNVFLSIPTSIIGTFFVMYFAHFTMNLFTLLALALVISIVVDDAIMVLENIIRHYRMKKSPTQAAYDGAHEVMGAAIASTLAVVAVFAPVIFMDGIIGKFFLQFGIVMSAAVLLSLVESMTITPMRASQFLKFSSETNKYEIWLDHKFEALGHFYQKSLNYVFKFRWISLSVGIAIFLASLSLFKFVKREFVPAQDQNFLILNMQTSLNSALEATVERAVEVEKVLKTIPEIQGYFLNVGSGGPSSSSNQGFIPITLVDSTERKLNHLQVMEKIRSALSSVEDVKFQLRDISTRNLSSGRTYPVSFNLRGPDYEILGQKADEIMKRLEDEKLGQDLDTDYKKGINEIRIYPRRDLIAKNGVSMDTVTRTINTAVAGSREGQFTQDGRRYDIRVKLEQGAIRSKDDIKKIYVRNVTGNLISLANLVDVEEKPVIQSITRINRQRSISVFGAIPPGQSQGKVVAEARRIAEEVLPPGYSFNLEGASAGFDDTFKSIYFALILGVIVAYMILAIQYNSFLHPISVLMALPFGLSGALLALWVSGQSLNLFSLIGVIVLMGISKKNSIMLVEFTNQVREKIPNAREALIIACPVRLRPILMTSFATMLAAIPLLLKTGIGKETSSALAITVLGGTFVSTLFTLYVIPLIYEVLSPLERSKKIEIDI
jgi:hydrophobe/amphiphile efflux-1 (HAE1) family protein